MRNLSQYPITTTEIKEALKHVFEETMKNQPIGDTTGLALGLLQGFLARPDIENNLQAYLISLEISE